MSTHHRIPFHFHALGHALSGEFRHPGRHLIDAQASTSLPTIGGHAVAHSDNFHFEDFVSFKSAHTHVSGRKIDAETFKTHATSIIEDLNILDVVTADRIVSRLTSTHNPANPEGHIIADGSEFHNLRIAGHAVRVILRHNLLVECKGFQDLRNHVEKGNESGRMVGRNEGAVICSLVDRIETDLPGVDSRRHIFKVANFGTISLAEVFAEPGARTLTMMRLELGSPHVADLTVTETSTNGQPPPPPLFGGTK
jgi:hypothetical protein